VTYGVGVLRGWRSWRWVAAVPCSVGTFWFGYQARYRWKVLPWMDHKVDKYARKLR